MNRRELLRNSGLAVGAFFSVSTLAAIETASLSPNAKPLFFNKDEFLLVTQLSEIIMPRTDTPGAIDVGVANTMDAIFTQVLKPEEQSNIREGLLAFNQLSEKLYRKPFLGLTHNKQEAFAKQLNKAFVERTNHLVKDASFADTAQLAIDFFGAIKQTTLTLFFRSEAGATKVLQYVAIPGPYRGDVPLKEIGKTWSVN